MSTIFAIADRLASRGRGTDPTRPVGRGLLRLRHAGAAVNAPGADPQQEQLPTFAPLLEEIELDGWSSHRRMLGGNFHDWMLLEGGRVLVMVGQAAASASCGPIETALIAQAAWTAIRAHAHHTDDAGRLLSLAARTLWTDPTMHQQASVAVAIVDSVGGSASLAMAGDAIVCRVRAAAFDQLPSDEPPLGAETNFNYTAREFALSLRERLILVADHPAYRGAKFSASLAADFTSLGAEAHRRMTASDALLIARNRYEHAIHENSLASASIVAVRRR